MNKHLTIWERSFLKNIVGKGENACYQHFLLFPQCFQKFSLSRSMKVGFVLQRVYPLIVPNKPYKKLDPRNKIMPHINASLWLLLSLVFQHGGQCRSKVRLQIDCNLPC